jgi:hypothetical protein
MQKTESINVQTDEYRYLEGNVVGGKLTNCLLVYFLCQLL